jgi:addiction module RelB/DinJ family antitoxin
MSNYSVINLKTDPKLKEKAAATAEKLGISISVVLNNELRRFTTEQSVTFELPEVPNVKTARQLDSSKKKIEASDYHKFDSNSKALKFLANELK